ncbi:MAG TPA: GNAT family N-acetyltransferase [Symbiobacteriaceae bacterium]|nr:GNAT family N-acetyltransferase [Symbiobacteriaceae bacterium]
MHLRAANPTEYPLLHDLFARAFKADEAELFDHLIAHDPVCVPEHIRVADVDGRPVAVTILLPRRMRSRFGWVDAAVITLVACEPALQRQGYGGATVRDALECARRQGLAYALLYGHPTYYPRFGFVPVLPGHAVIVPPAPGAERLAQAAPADLPWMTDLYHAHVATTPCAVARTPDPWLWALRNPSVGGLLTLPDRQGYAFVGRHKTLDVSEGAAADETAARRLLDGLRAEAAALGLASVRLIGAPDSQLERATANAEGTESITRPASAGMACILDWEPLLPAGYTVVNEGLAYNGELVFPAGPTELAQVVLGYRPGPDGFPELFPRWSLAPFWHAD